MLLEILMMSLCKVNLGQHYDSEGVIDKKEKEIQERVQWSLWKLGIYQGLIPRLPALNKIHRCDSCSYKNDTVEWGDVEGSQMYVLLQHSAEVEMRDTHTFPSG